jgi:hypothetical protein
MLNALCVGIRDHLYGWGPRLRLRRPTSVLVIKCTTLLTCIENTYCFSRWEVEIMKFILKVIFFLLDFLQLFHPSLNSPFYTLE